MSFEQGKLYRYLNSDGWNRTIFSTNKLNVTDVIDLRNKTIGEVERDSIILILEALAQTAALLTAWNPEGKKVSQQENIKAMESLELALNEMKLPFLPASGSDPKGAWKEESYLILGIALDQAESLGRQFQQNAFVWIETGHAPRLVWP